MVQIKEEGPVCQQAEEAHLQLSESKAKVAKVGEKQEGPQQAIPVKKEGKILQTEEAFQLQESQEEEPVEDQGNKQGCRRGPGQSQAGSCS